MDTTVVHRLDALQKTLKGLRKGDLVRTSRLLEVTGIVAGGITYRFNDVESGQGFSVDFYEDQGSLEMRLVQRADHSSCLCRSESE